MDSAAGSGTASGCTEILSISNPESKVSSLTSTTPKPRVKDWSASNEKLEVWYPVSSKKKVDEATKMELRSASELSDPLKTAKAVSFSIGSTGGASSSSVRKLKSKIGYHQH